MNAMVAWSPIDWRLFLFPRNVRCWENIHEDQGLVSSDENQLDNINTTNTNNIKQSNCLVPWNNIKTTYQICDFDSFGCSRALGKPICGQASEWGRDSICRFWIQLSLWRSPLPWQDKILTTDCIPPKKVIKKHLDWPRYTTLCQFFEQIIHQIIDCRLRQIESPAKSCHPRVKHPCKMKYRKMPAATLFFTASSLMDHTMLPMLCIGCCTTTQVHHWCL